MGTVRKELSPRYRIGSQQLVNTSTLRPQPPFTARANWGSDRAESYCGEDRPTLARSSGWFGLRAHFGRPVGRGVRRVQETLQGDPDESGKNKLTSGKSQRHHPNSRSAGSGAPENQPTIAS